MVRPATSRCRASSWRTVPTRHGTHWPQDSSRKNRAIRRHRSTRSTVASSTMITPEPSVYPPARASSNVSRTSRRSGPRNPPAAPPRRIALIGAPSRGAAGHVDRLGERDAVLGLIHPGMLDVTGQTEQPRPRRAFGAERGVGVGPELEDLEHVEQRLDVVDRRRTSEHAVGHRERRLVARLAALALDRVEQRGLLPADVGAGAAAQLDVEGEARVHDVRPEQGGRPRLLDRLVQVFRRPRVLASDVQVAGLRPRGEPGDRERLDQGERIVLHEHAILEGAGLRFVCVGDDDTWGFRADRPPRAT